MPEKAILHVFVTQGVGVPTDVELAGKFDFDHDLTCDIHYEDIHQPVVALEVGDQKKDGLLREDILVLSLYPDIPDEKQKNVKSEFIFMIDKSGSMSGNRIAKAEETLLFLLKSLSLGCRFNVVSFGDEYSFLFSKSKSYSADTLAKAIKKQWKKGADMGGTELLEALKAIYGDGRIPNEYSRQKFRLEYAVLVKRHCTKSTNWQLFHFRVFTFGIGDGVSTSLIRNVGKVSNGRAVFIKDHDNMGAKVIPILKESLRETIKDLTLNWMIAECVAVTNIPATNPVIFSGEKVVLFSIPQFDNTRSVNASGSVELKWTSGDKPIINTVFFETKGSTHQDLPLHRMAAKRLIKDLEIAEVNGSSNKDNIIMVSQASNVVSKYTAFVGLDKDTNTLLYEVHNKTSTPYSSRYGIRLKLKKSKQKMFKAEIEEEERMVKGSTSSPKFIHHCRDIWCTALVITYVEKTYYARQQEWELIINKAKTWIQSQDTEGKSENVLLEEARDSDVMKCLQNHTL
ncbi:unnamed protein product [Mytilus coruscus]|uniref:VWFA domain-containing protein n=1 Tax=Mytilus coruscus TaxID=42192 RepID=A0A6J8DSN5_MYTCO|nr:unnamed protein product [Mytilus coruscus]